MPSSSTSRGTGASAGSAEDGRVDDCVTGVMDPGEATLGSVADGGCSSGMLMGKFKVNRFVCRAPGWARGGNDDRFCTSDEDREGVVCSEAGFGWGRDSNVVWDASGTEPWTSPVPGELSIVGQPAERELWGKCGHQ